MLLAVNRPDEALKGFEAVLATEPGRFRSVYGAAPAAAGRLLLPRQGRDVVRLAPALCADLLGLFARRPGKVRSSLQLMRFALPLENSTAKEAPRKGICRTHTWSVSSLREVAASVHAA
jgi:hypothetical protein